MRPHISSTIINGPVEASDRPIVPSWLSFGKSEIPSQPSFNNYHTPQKLKLDLPSEIVQEPGEMSPKFNGYALQDSYTPINKSSELSYTLSSPDQCGENSSKQKHREAFWNKKLPFQIKLKQTPVRDDEEGEETIHLTTLQDMTDQDISAGDLKRQMNKTKDQK